MDATGTRTPRGPKTTCCGGAAPSGLGEDGAADLSRVLQVLGHPVRLQILDMLARAGDDVCVCDLETALPVKQPTVSHHLRILREAGLVDVERRGQWAHYRVRAEALQTVAADVRGWFESVS